MTQLDWKLNVQKMTILQILVQAIPAAVVGEVPVEEVVVGVKEEEEEAEPQIASTSIT